MKYTCSMETVQQNGRFTFFSSKFLSIYSILYGEYTVVLTKDATSETIVRNLYCFLFLFLRFPTASNFLLFLPNHFKLVKIILHLDCDIWRVFSRLYSLILWISFQKFTKCWERNTSVLKKRRSTLYNEALRSFMFAMAGIGWIKCAEF